MSTSSAGAGRTSRVGRRALAARPVMRIALVAVASLTAATTAPAVGTASAATTPQYSYTGSAFGTYVTVGSTVKSGKSAPLSLGCTTNADLHRTNSTSGVNAAPLAQSGAVSTTADTYASPVRSRTSANTASVNLLNGLVKASAVKAVSSTTRTTSGFGLSSTGTTLTGLVVAGRSVAANTAPNTRITLAGYGYLVVNEQVKKSNGLTVNGLHLVVNTTNALGITVGSNVIVSNAVTALSGPVAGVLGGYAYGSAVTAGTTAVSSPSFTAFMPCLGTGGVRRDNTGAGVPLGTTLKAGTIENTVLGTVTATSATGETTSTVQAADVLNGLVKASAVKADAHASRVNGTYSFSDKGSSFGTLSVTGQPAIGANVARNTKVALPGVGTLYLHRVVQDAHSVRVVMIELVLTNPVNGLAVGTDIQVANAKATVS